MNHIGIYLSNAVNKDWIIEEMFSNIYLREYIDLYGLRGELFSMLTINRMIDEEYTQLFINLLQAIASQHKVAIIYVSHRMEPELKPDKVYELIPAAEGSIGRIQ